MAELEDLLGTFTFPMDSPSSGRVRFGSGTDDGSGRTRDDDPDGDGGGAAGGTVSEERRRKRRLQRENERLRRELEATQERVAQVESSVWESRVAAARGSLEAQQAAARQRWLTAKDDQDSDAEVKALEALQEVNRRIAELDGSVRAAKAEQGGSAGSQADGQQRPKRNRAYEEWAEANDWYDPELSDFKSKAAGAMSQQLIQEGYQADDTEFFEELDRRLRKELPHHFRGPKARARKGAAEDDDDDLDVPGTAGRGRDGSRGNDRGEGDFAYNRAQIQIWKQHAKPDFDPNNAEHVAEFKAYHDPVMAKNNRRQRRG